MFANQKIDGLPENELDTINFSDLVFEKEVGRGSFGQVSKASYFGSDVAVKVLTSLVTIDPDYYKFMTREIKILKEMRHINIVQYLGACTHEGKYMIVTEYIKGGDLHQFIKEKGITNIPWTVKLRIALDIGSAFSYLHSKKIIFRDLKTKNILVDELSPGVIRAKVCDFGFARTLEGNDLKNNKDGYLTICGSETSMAPEVLVGMKYDSSCDVYSYGVLLLELICGTRVVKTQLKRAPSQFFEMNLERADYLAPETCPKALMELAKWCLVHQPEKRPTFKQIVDGLKVLVDTPIEKLSQKGKSKQSVKLEEDDDNQVDSSDDEQQNSTNGDEDTGSVVNYATVVVRDDVEQPDSVVYLPDQKTVNGIDYGGKNKRHNRITNPSFFQPPSIGSLGNLATSTTSTTSITSTTFQTTEHHPNQDHLIDDDGSKNLSSLYTSLSVEDIRLLTPDPIELLELYKKIPPHISSGAVSSPNLVTALNEVHVDIETPDTQSKRTSLTTSTAPNTPHNKSKKSKGKSKGKGKKKKR
ncbi:LISK family protein kinase [Tieghemostelium lacteum]|uniref:non-specific serine/threonine protein kinase n=1 Tax=Tieghemostelium lacteum TaxID=361077 RepID=A0A151ZJ91_TIELA|nr:LISK family protein kinase [Tieghemostelium lacteum]|eukprot:KYQ94026.1 LISK family protein kinase [Tieghemostelium lacteum]